jgi:hypothetical protein
VVHLVTLRKAIIAKFYEERQQEAAQQEYVENAEFPASDAAIRTRLFGEQIGHMKPAEAHEILGLQ